MRYNNYLLFFVSILLVGCTKYFKPTDKHTQIIAVSDSLQLPESAVSQKVSAYLSPLHDTLDARMNGVLVKSAKRLRKGQPESELGNVLTDFMLDMARERSGKPIAVAMTNSGGIRTELPEGNVTLGNVFEIMPFDNELVLVEVSGEVMQQFAEYIAARKEPQAGMKLIIDSKSNKINELSINGAPLDVHKTYWIVTSDYIVNSSDASKILKNRINYEPLKMLMRDAFAEGFRRMGNKNQVLNPKKDGRTVIK
jgi:2',3'-cyclic-nucleotide 2'-phosphodiesterase (5'-nucleotidase family)